MDYPLQSATNCQTHLVQVNQVSPSKESLYCNLIYRNVLFWSWLLPAASSPSHAIFMTMSSSLKPSPHLTRWGSKHASHDKTPATLCFLQTLPLTLCERLSCPWVPLSYCNPYTIPTHLMGETPAIKQRVHFAGSNLAFKQYAKACFLGTILLLVFWGFFLVTMQNMGYSHYSLDLIMAK